MPAEVAKSTGIRLAKGSIKKYLNNPLLSHLPVVARMKPSSSRDQDYNNMFDFSQENDTFMRKMELKQQV